MNLLSAAETMVCGLLKRSQSTLQLGLPLYVTHLLMFLVINDAKYRPITVGKRSKAKCYTSAHYLTAMADLRLAIDSHISRPKKYLYSI